MANRRLVILACGVLGCLGSSVTAQTQATYQIPLSIYRVDDAYSNAGVEYTSGIMDYFTLLNVRDGGIGGVKLRWDRCQMRYSEKDSLVCYEKQRQQRGKSPVYFDALAAEIGEVLYPEPLSIKASDALMRRSRADKLPVAGFGYGPFTALRGDIFPYQFAFGPNAYDVAYAAVKYMGTLAGSIGALKGKTIVTLHHGSDYGRRTNAFMDRLATRYGFSHKAVEVPHPANEQSEQWKAIRKLRPAYVFLRGWGLMTPVALQTAAKNGYSASRIVGNEWSNAEIDVLYAGKEANGYHAASLLRTGADFLLAEEIEDSLYNSGQGSLEDTARIGSRYWNLGVMMGVLVAEAIRLSQARFGTNLTSAHMRWGFEQIKLTQDDLDELGLDRTFSPMQLSCDDHNGTHQVRFQKWDADRKTWALSSSWINGSSEISKQMIDQQSQEYLAANPELKQRDCKNQQQSEDFGLSP